MIKILILLVLAAILISLASGLFFMMRDRDGQSTRGVRSLTVRIVLSVSLFALLVLGYFAGVIKPHGIYPQPPAAPPQEQGAITPAP